MKVQITYGQLKALMEDIISESNRSAAFFFFNKSRVERFQTANAIPLKRIESRIGELIKIYVEHDKDGQPVVETVEETLPTHGPSAEAKPRSWWRRALSPKAVEPVVSNGRSVSQYAFVSPELKEEYRKALDKFFKGSVTVEI